MPPQLLAVGGVVVYAGSCPAVPLHAAAPPGAAGWGLVALRAPAPWDVAARPPLAGVPVFGAAEVGAVILADRGGPVVADPTAAGFLGAPSHDPLSAALTSVAAALAWLASEPPAPAVVRVHFDLAANGARGGG